MLLELATSWRVPEAEETAAASYWAVVTTQESQEKVRQDCPLVTTVDSDTGATESQSGKEGL